MRFLIAWSITPCLFAAACGGRVVVDHGGGAGGSPSGSVTHGAGGSGASPTSGPTTVGSGGTGGSVGTTSTAASGGACGQGSDCGNDFCDNGLCRDLPPCGVSPLDSANWTLVTESVGETIDPSKQKRYLYLAPNDHWYLSPVTSLSWRWASYQPQEGSYAYCDGSKTGTFACTSQEAGQFGVGCSNGPGPTFKTLPIYEEEGSAGKCEICQDQPNAFGGAVCEKGTSIYFRYVP